MRLRDEARHLAVLDFERIERRTRADNDVAVMLETLFQPHVSQQVVTVRQRRCSGFAAVTRIGRCFARQSAGQSGDRAGGGQFSRPAEK